MSTTITCNRCSFTVTSDNVLDAIAADQAHEATRHKASSAQRAEATR